MSKRLLGLVFVLTLSCLLSSSDAIARQAPVTGGQGCGLPQTTLTATAAHTDPLPVLKAELMANPFSSVPLGEASSELAQAQSEVTEIVYSNRPPGGAWSAPEGISPASGARWGGADLVVDAHGTAHILWNANWHLHYRALGLPVERHPAPQVVVT